VQNPPGKIMNQSMHSVKRRVGFVCHVVGDASTVAAWERRGCARRARKRRPAWSEEPEERVWSVRAKRWQATAHGPLHSKAGPSHRGAIGPSHRGAIGPSGNSHTQRGGPAGHPDADGQDGQGVELEQQAGQRGRQRGGAATQGAQDDEVLRFKRGGWVCASVGWGCGKGGPNRLGWMGVMKA